MSDPTTYTAFAGTKRIAAGDLRTVLVECKRRVDADDDAALLVFDDATGRQADFNFHGTVDEMLERELPATPRTGPGRPKLGVVSREVSLLPRHWEWLEEQPSGISGALRRLVEEAMKRAPDQARARRATDAAAHFMTTMAGNLPGFEEALRALYRKEGARFTELVRKWPRDIREHVEKLAADAMPKG